MPYAAALHLRVCNNGDALPVHRGFSAAGSEAGAGMALLHRVGDSHRNGDRRLLQHGRLEHVRPLRRAELVKRMWHVLNEPETGDVQAYLRIDLDNLKSINDEAGSAAGDWAMCQIATRFNDVVRSRDTLARLDGGAFGLLLERCPLDNARQRAEQLHQSVQSYALHWNGTIFRLGARIGLAFFKTRRHSLNTILSAADAACAQAWRQGGDGVCIHETLLD